MSMHDWRAGFLFVGNHLALDFVNTKPLMDGSPRELLPDNDALLRWLSAAGLIEKAEANGLRHPWRTLGSNSLQALRDFRERLREVVLQIENGRLPSRAFVQRLNTLLLEHPLRQQLEATRDWFTARLYFHPERPEDVFAPLASDVVALLTTADRSRLRKCQNCVLHYYDTSKKGTRIWCSMNLCGNRAKVAAYTERRRSMGRVLT